MGLLDLFRPRDINKGVKDCAATEGALLLDVREADEYNAGHIPKAVNLPLSRIATVVKLVPDRGTPLFLYCLTGNRSNSAVGALKRMGYEKLTNIGGIRGWRGEVEQSGGRKNT